MFSGLILDVDAEATEMDMNRRYICVASGDWTFSMASGLVLYADDEETDMHEVNLQKCQRLL